MKSNDEVLEAVVRAAYDISRGNYAHPELSQQDIQNTFVYDQRKSFLDLLKGRETRTPVGADVGYLHDIPVKISARVQEDTCSIKPLGRIDYSVDAVIDRAREYIKND